MFKKLLFSSLLLILLSLSLFSDDTRILATGTIPSGYGGTLYTISIDFPATRLSSLQLCINRSRAIASRMEIMFLNSSEVQRVNFTDKSFNPGDCSEMIDINGGMRMVQRVFLTAKTFSSESVLAQYMLLGYKQTEMTRLGRADVPYQNIDESFDLFFMEPLRKKPVDIIQFCFRKSPLIIDWVEIFFKNGLTQRINMSNYVRQPNTCSEIKELAGNSERTIDGVVIKGGTLRGQSPRAEIELLGYNDLTLSTLP